ncbi:hypothetical protein QAD02_011955 [Eretmocerus hayati]|uniref:Uncharacterized protein n=1 Tax=Eretmocerus hayati TaxID=131215 RepID=A0ACC2NYL7_9HYME|nr:hypothetical protein QAD02_011955 [Eretmocerus hayati]
MILKRVNNCPADELKLSEDDPLCPVSSPSSTQQRNRTRQLTYWYTLEESTDLRGNFGTWYLSWAAMCVYSGMNLNDQKMIPRDHLVAQVRLNNAIEQDSSLTGNRGKIYWIWKKLGSWHLTLVA